MKTDDAFLNRDQEIRIIGAGATGLSLALFLAERGYKPRLMDRRPPSVISKALGINPNTLLLLESSGVTERFLKNGWKAQTWNYRAGNKLLYRSDLSKVKHKYPFMLIQPQNETESILAAALEERGITIERGIELIDMLSMKDRSKLALKKVGSDDILTEEVYGIVVASDGSHSTSRNALGITFDGWDHDEEFFIYDIELSTSLPHNEVHYFMFREGGMLMLHIRDGVWRVAGNMLNVLSYLPAGTRVGKISWEAVFSVSERVASTFSTGKIFILGDAAHIHSPVGAKGMNLCIEDSHIFAKLVSEGREAEFSRLRRPVIRKNVSLLGQLTDKIGGNNMLGRTLRQNAGKLSFLFPLVMPRMNKFLLGLK